MGENDYFLTLVRNENSGGLAISLCLWFGKDNSTEHSEWKKEEEVDRRRSKKAVLKSRQGLLSPRLGQLKTKKEMERGCCKVIYSAPTTLQGYGIDLTAGYL